VRKLGDLDGLHCRWWEWEMEKVDADERYLDVPTCSSWGRHGAGEYPVDLGWAGS
jgi:hypothetical protein